MKKLLIISAISFLFCGKLFSQSIQDTIHLNAIASDQDGTIASYQWSQVSGPACTLTGNNSIMLVVSFTNAGHYVFQCIVTDNGGKTSTAQSSGDVLPANIPPTLKISPSTFTIKLQ